MPVRTVFIAFGMIASFALSGCDETQNDPLQNKCIPRPDNCTTTEFAQGTLTLRATIVDPNVPLRVKLYRGNVDDGQLMDTLSLNTEFFSLGYPLPPGDYSAETEYSYRGFSIVAVNGDPVRNDKTEYCEGPCYSLHNSYIDITFDRQAFDQFLDDKDAKCFIATAAFGGADAPEVRELRDFRDRVLARNPVGRCMVRLYYRFSPPIAELIRDSCLLQGAVRGLLHTIIAIIRMPAMAVGGLMMVVMLAIRIVRGGGK